MHSWQLFASRALIASCMVALVTPAQTKIVPGIGSFTDISPAGPGWGGIPITGVTDDSIHVITTTVGNALFPAGSIVIGSNGFAVSGSSTASAGWTNYAIPTHGLPTNVSPGGYSYVMPFWDDLDPIGTTSGATSIYYWESPFTNALHIQWNNIGHFADVLGQSITFQMIVYNEAINDCGVNPFISFVYLDTTFGGTQIALDYGLSATIGYVAGVGNPYGNAVWSFNTGSVFSGTHLQVWPNEFLLTASSPGGSGTLQLDFTGGPCNGGTYILALTLAQGLFPDGWLYGLDIPIAQLVSQVATGFPFVGPLIADSTGSSFTLGPFSGVPPGFQFWAVGLGYPTGGIGSPTVHTLPITYLTP